MPAPQENPKERSDSDSGRQKQPGSPPQAPQQQFNWNPSGYWPDPYAERFRTQFRPHEFIGAMLQTPEAQDYANPESTAETLGTQSVRAGEQKTIDKSNQEAANQGLGRGFAAQQESDIREQGNIAVSDNILGAHLEGQSRRYQQAAMLAASLLESNKSRFTAYLNSKAQSAANQAGFLGFLGDVVGGALSGFALGGPVGAVAGGAAGAVSGANS